MDLTIAIPVKNEEVNLRGCLESIGNNFARKVVVVDSGSTDRTCKIAKECGVDIVEFRWNGLFPKKRNWFLRNYSVDTKWILFLDADEYLTEEFKLELREKLEQDDKVGYLLSYTIYFLGRRLKGGYPLRKLALFQIGKGEYERIDEEKWSNFDMEIHEHPVLSGPIGIIKSKIDHRDFRGVSHYVIKHNEYANWEAHRFLKEKGADWTWKQRLKYSLMKSVFIGPAYFFGSFFILGGFRDGARGLSLAILKASYFIQVYCKIREIQGRAKDVEVILKRADKTKGQHITGNRG
jgi:glycosyltransferase involved in cell wall biosynthesis